MQRARFTEMQNVIDDLNREVFAVEQVLNSREEETKE
ncbi:hypothetical protein BMS3Abin10_00624 [bacterium BMS3Abin10]|nr:hypothetical protein BMS3Abin10_00624 [bacterium BMS3Abin10]GBE39728.1 hypothetical protein BMS3Bbin08_02359 [bacterium BMS3Bbin08]